MRIVIPSSTADVQRLPRFMDVLEKFRGLAGYEIVFIPQRACVSEAHEACARANKFTAAQVIPMDQDYPAGWPRSCNMQFQFAARAIARLPNPQPWFWMELDCLPIKPGWAEALNMEYHAKGARFLGNLVPTQFKRDDGTYYTQADDMVMLGVAVYHHGLGNADCLINNLINVENEAWDIYMRYDFKRFGMADSEVIADKWSTRNYRIEHGDLVCDPYPREIPVPNVRSGKVPKSAYLVHGCKDDTLADIVMGVERYSAAEKVVIPPEGLPEPIVIDEVLIVPSMETRSQGEAVIVTVDFDDVVDALPEPPKKEWLEERLSEGSLRLGFCASEWGVSSAEARKIITDLGYKISGPGWVKK